MLVMLRLFLSHEGTHALGVVLCVSFLARWTAREANKTAHIEAFLQRIKPVSANPKPGLSSTPAPQSSGVKFSSKDSSEKKRGGQGNLVNRSLMFGMRRVTLSLGRNLSTLTTKTYLRNSFSHRTSMRTSRSATALRELMKRSSSKDCLCPDCFSRASSHSSLVDMEKEQTEESPGVASAVVLQTDTQQAKEAKVDTPPISIGLNGNDDGGSRVVGRVNLVQSKEEAPVGQSECTICAQEARTWSHYFKKAILALTASATIYLSWLRFLAKKETALRHLIAVFRVFQRLFGYTVKGASRLPRTGPAVGMIYHGWLPIDMYFLQEYIISNVRQDCMVMVADFVFKIPFVGWMVKLGGGVPASRGTALEHLKKGGLLIVAPGGVAEAMTPASADYKLLWDRSGFAEVARQASAPIFPIFTRNIREVFLVLFGGNSWIQWLYKKTKLPFTPFIGPF